MPPPDVVSTPLRERPALAFVVRAKTELPLIAGKVMAAAEVNETGPSAKLPPMAPPKLKLPALAVSPLKLLKVSPLLSSVEAKLVAAVPEFIVRLLLITTGPPKLRGPLLVVTLPPSVT